MAGGSATQDRKGKGTDVCEHARAVPYTAGSFIYSLISPEVLGGGCMSSFTTPCKCRVKHLANANTETLALVCLNPKVVVFEEVRFTGNISPCTFQ